MATPSDPSPGGDPLRVVHVVAEYAGVLQTGALGEVVAGLAEAQAARGHEVEVITPCHHGALTRFEEARLVGELEVAMPWGPIAFAVYRAVARGVGLRLLVEPALFGRERLYGVGLTSYSDNPVRFAAFCRAAVQLVDGVDVAHLHDWHAGLAAPLLTRYGVGGDGRPRVVMTVHELAFQGAFLAAALSLTGLPPDALSMEGVLHHERINPLKAGIQYADLVTTLSPTYARELQTEAYGKDLAGLFRHRSADLVGIVNGLAPDRGDDRERAHEDRRAALCGELGIEPPPGPLIALVSRLTARKGADLALAALPAALARGAGAIVMGEGEPRLAEGFRALAATGSSVRFIAGFDPALAERVARDADIVCVPGRHEPCGTVHLHGMRGGAVPVVRATGGLSDTVFDVADGGWGVVFREATVGALEGALARAIALYEDRAGWRSLQERVMARPVGWEGPVEAYLDAYRRALGA